MKKAISFPLVIFLETLIIYLLVIIPTEYLLTEKFLFIPHITTSLKTALFVVVFLLVFLANRSLSGFWQKSQKLLPLLLILFAASLFLNRTYANFYNSLQNKPKIFATSSSWGIQAMPVVITGKNFGPVWRSGQVYVDQVSMLVKDWSEEKIVITLPVPPKHFKGQLFVVSAEGEKSNAVAFEIRNPDFLKGIH